MSSKLIKILSVICLFLMLIIALEWIYGTRAQKNCSVRAIPQKNKHYPTKCLLLV